MKAELIDFMGDDLRVVNAARVSFKKESLEFKDDDKGLVNYLARHGHWTPFAHPQITMRYTVPIFVARQEFKHIVGFARNEVSRRYVDDDPEFFTPDIWRSRPEGGIKQGSGDKDLSQTVVYDRLSCKAAYALYLDHAEDLYKGLIAAKVAPEQARMVLPQSMYTSYYVTGSLAAFARFFRQRTDEHAQIEIQDLAKQVGDLISPLFPVSWEALTSE